MQPSPGPTKTPYTVVARRYRPQAFDDLIGQSHVVTALGNAIRQNRVGHAYLFTGARGVGKTSAARIFAKCLNCVTGPTPTPCNQCDICQLVSTGEDIDVIEIDGASNRGIDEIRELRSNAGVRPSRARYKIYIIDEVHMLTREAFNALLKTLEEPPGHVKFLFCTTDPQKIPITVLSRCQRFDFVPVDTPDIAGRLREIAEAEGVAAEPAALDLLARRAGGSMRDSQSLLEQLLSFSDQALTVADVHRLLGTADLSTIATIARGIAGSEPGLAIAAIHSALSSGADPARFAQQLVTYTRDLLALASGCGPGLMLQVGAGDLPEAELLAQQFGLERLLAVLQILDAAVVRMQSSPHARIILEAAVARAATLSGVLPISQLVSAAGQALPALTPAASSAGPIKPVLPVAVATPPASPDPAGSGEPVSGATAKAAATGSTTEPQAVDPSTPAGTPKKKEPVAEAEGPEAEGLTDQEREGTGATAAPIASREPMSASSMTAPVESRRGPMAVASSSASTTATATPPRPAQTTATADWNPQRISELWQQLLTSLQSAGDMMADMVSGFSRLESFDRQQLTVTLQREYDCQLCNDENRKRRLESTLAGIAGHPVRLEFRFDPAAQAVAAPAAPRMSRVQRLRSLEQNPMVRCLIERFDAEITDFDERRPTKPLAPR